MIKIIRNISEMQRYANSCKRNGEVIGFVPTMGFLHEGHLSLVREAKKNSDKVVVSIFVNPTQFAPNEDLDKYPRDFVRDENLLSNENVDVIFYPEAHKIYPADFSTYVEVEKITKKIEGEARPTHFRGVTTIVSILFNIVKPDVAIFGQKDAQQATVIKRMVKDLCFDIKIITAPIIREEDGLAMSSRNTYLNETERKDALILSKSLQVAKTLINNGEKTVLIITNKIEEMISERRTTELEYIKVVESTDFIEVKKLQTGKSYYILIACKVGKTRLIDNVLLEL